MDFFFRTQRRDGRNAGFVIEGNHWVAGGLPHPVQSGRGSIPKNPHPHLKKQFSYSPIPS
ncbi:hypothetical protein LEP1GSC199_0341 [Leptospira vanthielii serovar Holland str. Waz Holland = ATCC 700522]|uniref:Uncharacterized protein n=1 Tax=Leptospira vanthielii serovar Holland str. Waz Holland = ATCC 700522 TaxID=1218591 RepID=N1WCD6_9LEPT|nr:hypothetical protein LEP1GSC199_0341 [Leptospira vanthielii serovar Holland str. Waz Holland = ATCC 700522]